MFSKALLHFQVKDQLGLHPDKVTLYTLSNLFQQPELRVRAWSLCYLLSVRFGVNADDVIDCLGGVSPFPQLQPRSLTFRSLQHGEGIKLTHNHLQVHIQP